jgi:hypothetical protein
LGSGPVISAPADIAEEKTDLGAHAGAALSKVSESAQQAGSHVKEAATSLATKAGEKAKGFIDQQVASGAVFLGYIGNSARVAAEMGLRSRRCHRARHPCRRSSSDRNSPALEATTYCDGSTGTRQSPSWGCSRRTDGRPGTCLPEARGLDKLIRQMNQIKDERSGQDAKVDQSSE